MPSWKLSIICNRRLFPAPLVTLRGLNPSKDYNITLRVASVDTCRYRFFNMQWTVVGESEVYQNEARQMYIHPSSPRSGEFWMKRPISFRTVKITHNPSSKNGNVSSSTSTSYYLECGGFYFRYCCIPCTNTYLKSW